MSHSDCVSSSKLNSIARVAVTYHQIFSNAIVKNKSTLALGTVNKLLDYIIICYVANIYVQSAYE